MEVMGFHIIDVVIVTLVAFLAIKGLVNGFSKELLSFISIVLGVVLAARYNLMIVELINEQKLFPPIPEEFEKIIGFVLIVITISLLISFISSIISKLTTASIGFFSRVLGYILSATRYMFIFSLIIFGVSQLNFFKKSAEKFKSETKLFTPMTNIGAKILNIDLNNSLITENTLTKESKENNLTDTNLRSKPSTTLVENNSSN